MQFVEEIRLRLEGERDLFRGQLLKEDLARLNRLEELARELPDLEAFLSEGLLVGWTQGDFRTHELRQPLTAVLEAFHACARADGTPEWEARLRDAWDNFNYVRMEKLVGCLTSRPGR